MYPVKLLDREEPLPPPQQLTDSYLLQLEKFYFNDDFEVYQGLYPGDQRRQYEQVLLRTYINLLLEAEAFYARVVGEKAHRVLSLIAGPSLLTGIRMFPGLERKARDLVKVVNGKPLAPRELIDILWQPAMATVKFGHKINDLIAKDKESANRKVRTRADSKRHEKRVDEIARLKRGVLDIYDSNGLKLVLAENQKYNPHVAMSYLRMEYRDTGKLFAEILVEEFERLRTSGVYGQAILDRLANPEGFIWKFIHEQSHERLKDIRTKALEAFRQMSAGIPLFGKVGDVLPTRMNFFMRHNYVRKRALKTLSDNVAKDFKRIDRDLALDFGIARDQGRCEKEHVGDLEKIEECESLMEGGDTPKESWTQYVANTLFVFPAFHTNLGRRLYDVKTTTEIAKGVASSSVIVSRHRLAFWWGNGMKGKFTPAATAPIFMVAGMTASAIDLYAQRKNIEQNLLTGSYLGLNSSHSYYVTKAGSSEVEFTVDMLGVVMWTLVARQYADPLRKGVSRVVDHVGKKITTAASQKGLASQAKKLATTHGTTSHVAKNIVPWLKREAKRLFPYKRPESWGRLWRLMAMNVFANAAIHTGILRYTRGDWGGIFDSDTMVVMAGNVIVDSALVALYTRGMNLETRMFSLAVLTTGAMWATSLLTAPITDEDVDYNLLWYVAAFSAIVSAPKAYKVALPISDHVLSLAEHAKHRYFGEGLAAATVLVISLVSNFLGAGAFYAGKSMLIEMDPFYMPSTEAQIPSFEELTTPDGGMPFMDKVEKLISPDTVTAF